MSTKKPIEEYIEEARRLQGRFPALKKFTKRRTLKPHEKGQISRAVNMAKIAATPRRDREERWRNYDPPRLRRPPVKSYANIAKELLQFANNAKTKKLLRKLIKRKKFMKPWEKAYITRTRKTISLADPNIFPISKEMAKKIPPEARRGKGGISAIKLKNVNRLDKIEEKHGDLIVTASGRRWYYRPVDFEWRELDQIPPAFANAAEAAFDNKAKQVFFWTVHGRVGTGAASMNEFLRMLRQDYMGYMSETIQQEELAGIDYEQWLLGIAILYT